MKYWLLNAVCGVLVLFLLGIHMAVMHLDDVLALVIGTDPAPLDWSRVTLRGESRFFTITYVILLGSALFHGLYGLHTMLTELWSGPRAARLIPLGCWVAGVFLFLVGSIATVSFHLTG